MRTAILAPLALLALSATALAAWQPAKGPLMTRWAKDVSPEKVLPEHPRPQLVRPTWKNLNGLWSYAVRPREAAGVDRPDGQILVPFPIESALSGVMQRVSDQQRLWYRRQFDVDPRWRGQRVLLHFGAVDWEATVSVNGTHVGTHRGGYDPFTFDITEALKAEGPQELSVAVWDPTDKSYQPRGKQVQRPEGIWYTPTTGIWQTVWLEAVPAVHVRSLRITPDVDRSLVSVRIVGEGIGPRTTARLTVHAASIGERSGKLGAEVASAAGRADGTFEIKLAGAKLWSPDAPQLYDLRVELSDGATTDVVTSYFGLRKSSLGKDQHGTTRVMLNNQPLFQYGPLDQGFWPDGLYTAPTDAALRYDIEMTKKLGFNMARKHVKVEPARWYYHCDVLGLLVWQDMPSGDRYIGPKDPDVKRSAESAANYEREWKAIIDALRHHPSIVMWVPFNEGWGQFDTARIVELTRQHDPTRLVNNASGWTDRGVGDVHDLHVYPGPGSPPPESSRAAVLGEFGGLGLPLRGHTWQDEKNWGYRSFPDAKSLTEAYVGLLERMHPLVGSPGLSAAVYTQTTDVEIEVNGLMTYDRALVKPDAERIVAAARRLYEAPPKTQTVFDTAQKPGIKWRYVTSRPADDWMKPDYKDGDWKLGEGGFGTSGTPGGTVRTTWNSGDIWLRRDVIIPDRKLEGLLLSVCHDEDAEVYLNGVLAAEAKGFTTGYELLPLSAAGRAALKPGVNLVAVHCHQTRGGQFIDVGLVETIPGEPLRAAAAPGQWQPLFDGKTLGAWKSTPFGGEGEVAVEDGKIVLPQGSELTGITWTSSLPKWDYEIALDACRIDGSDFFCGLTFPVGDDPCSFIVGGWGGGVMGLSSINGLDAANNDTTKYREFTQGRWYNVRVRVTRAKIETWIDGEQVVSQDLGGKRISIRSEVELSKPLGVSSYSTRAGLKNLRLRTLKPDEVPAVGQ